VVLSAAGVATVALVLGVWPWLDRVWLAEALGLVSLCVLVFALGSFWLRRRVFVPPWVLAAVAILLQNGFAPLLDSAGSPSWLGDLAGSSFRWEATVGVGVGLFSTLRGAWREEQRRHQRESRRLRAMVARADALRAEQRHMAHGMKATMLVLRSSIAQIEAWGARSGDPSLSDAIRFLRHGCDSLAALVRSERQGVHRIDIRAVLDLEFLGARTLGLRVVEVRGPASPVMAEADPLVLSQALREVLCNVVEHAPAARLVVDLLEEGETVRIRLDDDGPGFPPPGEPDSLVRRSGSPDNATEPGQGLSLVRTLLESQGGHLVLGRGELGGARVELRLRRAAHAPRPEYRTGGDHRGSTTVSA
jgi:signal transduction histidine kinase